jgi:hypothetical protein
MLMKVEEGPKIFDQHGEEVSDHMRREVPDLHPGGVESREVEQSIPEVATHAGEGHMVARHSALVVDALD